MIPIAKPFLGKGEAAAASKAILSGWVTQGPRVEQFEKDFASYVGSRYACAVSSCTTALHIALLAVGVKPGDAVITVSHSFIATANSIRHCGAEPIFADIDPETFNISCEALERCLTKGRKMRRVAAIMPVHQMGMPADLKSVLSIARKFNIPVVEDAACAIGSEISMTKGRTWNKIGKPHGDIACFSFHPRKVITTGEGGMLTTNNAEYDKNFRLLRQHGMSLSDRARHLAKKISVEAYVTTGYNYRMTDIQAAIGIEQLKCVKEMVARRRRLALRYKKELSAVSWLKLPVEPEYARTNWQSYPVRVLKGAPRSRNGLMQYLLDKGIATRRGIMNAHQELPYSRHREVLKNSESARDSVILLPLFYELKDSEIKKIAGYIKDA